MHKSIKIMTKYKLKKLSPISNTNNIIMKTFDNFKIISWFFDIKKYVPIANNPNLKYVIDGLRE